jgi:hypothetical protein
MFYIINDIGEYTNMQGDKQIQPSRYNISTTINLLDECHKNNSLHIYILLYCTNKTL